MSNILILNDLPGYGSIASMGMRPVLLYYGHEVFVLPSLLISNTLDYGKFTTLDTTAYIAQALTTYEELGFIPDVIATGFVAGSMQAQEFCRLIDERKAEVWVDPIMADNGKLYHGVDEGWVKGLRELASRADVLLPNATESAFLLEETPSFLTEEEARRRLERLHCLGAKSILITSCEDEKGKHSVWGYDGEENRTFQVPYEHLPIHLAGTGDLFSSVLLAETMTGQSLEEATRVATTALSLLLARVVDCPPRGGIVIHRHFDALEEAHHLVLGSSILGERP